MSDRIRLLLVDDHEIFLDGLSSLLSTSENIHIQDHALNGADAMVLIRKDQPDILLTDLNMPGLDGIALVKQVKEEFPEVKVIVLTMHNDRPTVSEIMMAEAEGYVLKNTSKKDLLNAIQRVAEGGTYYSNEVISIMLARVKEIKKKEMNAEECVLTDREKEILQLIAEEKSSEEIAEQLFISRRTVETHRKNILHKVNSRTVVGLIKYAFRHDLVSVN